MTHDFAAQKAETYDVFGEIQGNADLPENSDID